MVMIMLILLFLPLITAAIVYNLSVVIYCVWYKLKINKLLENINAKEDLAHIPYKDFINLVAEIFKREGYRVKRTDKCGEFGNGLILNDLQFVEVWKYVSNPAVDVEVAMNLAKCMQTCSIHRGKLVSLRDFKQNTRLFCHKNVIECISAQQILEMCKEVRKRREVLQTD